jgi:hypothetical protein
MSGHQWHNELQNPSSGFPPFSGGSVSAGCSNTVTYAAECCAVIAYSAESSAELSDDASWVIQELLRPHL